MKKADAIGEVKSRGFTIHYDTGQRGDYPHGSRLYYRKPGATMNASNQPDQHATISRIKGHDWRTSYFE